MEHKEYEGIREMFLRLNTDPEAFAAVDKQYKDALREIEERRRRR